MSDRTCQAIVLAAGEGTRMKSATPKVLHAIAGQPMLSHVMKTAGEVGASRIDVVVGPGMDAVSSLVARELPDAGVHVQKERLGTAHAVLAARKALEKTADDVLVLYGDTPLITVESLHHLREALDSGAAIAVLGFRTLHPRGYGRLISDEDHNLLAIREEKDATSDERSINFCNSGVMAFHGETLLESLDKVGNDNANNEYYLTDTVAIAREAGLSVIAVEGHESEVLGINSRAQLAQAEAIAQRNLRNGALDAGVTMIAPETVFLSVDTIIENDVLIEPNVFFGSGVVVRQGAVIRANSHIEGAEIGPDAVVGPFARLRPGTRIGKAAKIGNFVEVKNSEFGDSAKANHLAYIGDSSVGAAANIGAGVITCNYDGYRKHRTEIGDGAFIGTNSSLVAPVKIGDGAYIGTGSVISRDVKPDSLAVERSKQIEREGWAKAKRDRMTKNKPKKQ